MADAKQNHSPLKKVLAATVAGFIVLALAFNFALRQQQDHELQVHLDADFAMLQNEIESNIQIRSGWMKTSLLVLQHSLNAGGGADAMQQADHERLYHLAEDFYLNMKRNNRVTYMYFMDQQRRVLLRMHQPDRFGDVINSQTAVQAGQQGAAISGVELGPLGALMLRVVVRVVVPWVVGGESIGYIETGMELEDILNTIEEDSSFRIILTLHKKLLDRQSWQPAQQMVWDLLDHDVIVFPATGVDEWLGGAGGFLNNIDARPGVVEIEGRHYEVAFQPFADTTGQKIGQLIMLDDISGEHEGLTSALYAAMALFALIAIAMVVLLYLIISRAEKERAAAEKKLKLASEAISNTVDGIIITDSEGVIIDVNAAFVNVTGFSRKEALGNRPQMLQSENYDETFYRDMWDSIKQHGRWQGRIVNRRKNGELYPEALSITAICDESGAVKNYIGVFSDISESEALQHQIHQAQRME
ncbi:MAG: hypothetical protein AUJ57_04940 [Zetaproteobacteria bacterium CG1_02_53_45]|nr:MAG: hypothetical protein AUJ57_04940 [Zetaproteobacteria bacterium CG1_02_53_45]